MTVKVACLGAGYFSRFHLDGWARLKDAEIVGVADKDKARASATGHIPFNDLAQMLNATQPDILDIIVPPDAHAAAIDVALAAGIKTIICQKPFCGTLATAQRIVAKAAKTDSTIVVHENFRFQPWFRVIRDAIAQGRIGTPLQATFRLRPGDGQGKDAYLARQAYFQTMPRFLVHETGVHYIDVFRFLFGNPTAVYADLRRVNPVITGEDAGVMTFDHPNGVRAILDANRSLDHAATNTRCTMGEGLFEGTGGALTLTGDGAVHLRAFGAHAKQEILGPSTTNSFGGDCTFLLQEHILGAILKNLPLENEAADYLSVMQIEDAIYASSEQAQKVKLDEFVSYPATKIEHGNRG